ncbi:similar to An03g02230 [Aspergillus luchuensis]|uniref:Similar to An03g02230 n=1 Tax=Aspergillus kawachii TaxID=1069201 RepID=A0A146F4U2_ASPKA|nr:similar to An03g02230 [Aspergillus luchuensis]
MTSPDLHPPAEIRAAAMAVANALTQYETYALVGGSACVILGSTRATLDIDFVVSQGKTSNARQLLRASPDFEVEARTNHTTYKTRRPVQIEILTPPLLFKEPFDHNTGNTFQGLTKFQEQQSSSLTFLFIFMEVKMHGFELGMTCGQVHKRV